MKTMKSLGVCLISLFVSIALTSCGDDYHSRLPELIIKNLEFSSVSDTQEITFPNEDLTNYSISADSSWCEAKIYYDQSKIVVRVDKNTSYDSRTCHVTISDVRDLSMRTFTVSQAQSNAMILPENSFDVSSEGGKVSVKVQSNINYNVTISDDAASWITRSSSTRGLVETSIEFSVATNNSGGARSGQVSIKSEDGAIEKTIRIVQMFTPVYDFNGLKSFTLDELAQTIEIPFTANFKLDAYSNDEYWVTNAGREEVGDRSYVQKFNVKAFTEKEKSRTTTVVFENPKITTGESSTIPVSYSIAITQERTLYFKPDTIKIIKGDSVLISDSVYNPKNRTLSWKSSNSDRIKVYVDAKDSKKIWAKASGDYGEKATVTVSSEKYSDDVVVAIQKPLDMTNLLVCKWDSTKSVKDGVSITSLIFKVTNTSDVTISLKEYAAYKDSLDTNIWYGETLSKQFIPDEEYTIPLGIVPTTGYYISLKYEYMKETYILKYMKDGKKTISKEEKTAATRRFTRSRKR